MRTLHLLFNRLFFCAAHLFCFSPQHADSERLRVTRTRFPHNTAASGRFCWGRLLMPLYIICLPALAPPGRDAARHSRTQRGRRGCAPRGVGRLLLAAISLPASLSPPRHHAYDRRRCTNYRATHRTAVPRAWALIACWLARCAHGRFGADVAAALPTYAAVPHALQRWKTHATAPAT